MRLFLSKITLLDFNVYSPPKHMWTLHMKCHQQ